MSDPVILALIAAVTSIVIQALTLVSSLRNAKRLDVVHAAVNGQTERLVAVTGAAQRAEGKLEGAQEEKEKHV